MATYSFDCVRIRAMLINVLGGTSILFGARNLTMACKVRLGVDIL